MNFQDPKSISSTLYSDGSGLKKRIDMWKQYGCSETSYKEFLLINLPKKFTDYLDVGCGNAIYSSEIASFASCSCTLLDCSPNILNDAKRNIEQHGVSCPIQFVCGDICELPFNKNSFDFITVMHVFHHVKNIDNGIRELCRVLKADGTLLITTYDKNLQDELNKYHYLALAKLKFPASMSDTAEYLKFSGINARTYLSEYFQNITEYDFENYMEIDDIEDVMAYYASAMMFRMFHGEKNNYPWDLLYQTVKDNVSEYMLANKTIRVSGNVKMFIITKSGSEVKYL